MAHLGNFELQYIFVLWRQRRKKEGHPQNWAIALRRKEEMSKTKSEDKKRPKKKKEDWIDATLFPTQALERVMSRQ